MDELPRDPEALLARLSMAASLDEAILIRGELIKVGESSGDPRTASWLVEQAAAVLDRLRRDGADASVLLGIPTPQQLTSVASAAEEAFALIARADDLAARAVARLQEGLIDPAGDPGAVRAAAEAAERHLMRLVDVEQSVRIPFFRGRAAVLLAALEPQKGPREEFIRVTLESLGKLRLGTVAAESSRRVALGAVLIMLAQGNEAQLAQARELLRWVAEHPPADSSPGSASEAPDAVTRAEAWMGLLRAARTPADYRGVREALAIAALTEPFVVRNGAGESEADPLLALLIAEASAKSLLLMPRDPSARVEHLNDAFAPLVALLSREDLRGRRAVLRPLVLAKIGAATDPLMPVEQLDPMIAFARAVMLAGSGASAGNPEQSRRKQALTLLTSVAQRQDADAAVRAEALWELAVLLWESGQPAEGVEAVAALVHLAEQFPEAPRAPEAAAKAVEMSRFTLAAMAKEPVQDRTAQERLSSLYGRALEAAVKLAPANPESGQKRLERARLALEGNGGAAAEGAVGSSGDAEILTPEQLEAALSALEGIPANDPRRTEADTLAQQAVDRAIAAAQQALARAVAADGHNSVLAGPARERLIAIARRSVQWAQQRRPGELDKYRLVLADALLDSGDARAAAVYEDIVSRSRSGDMNLRARLGLGRSQRLARQHEQAFATLRSLTDELERAAAASRARQRHPVYWLAWAEMLEILSADNRDGRRTDTIRVQISRLALVDPQFGGEEAQRRIEAIKKSVEGK